MSPSLEELEAALENKKPPVDDQATNIVDVTPHVVETIADYGSLIVGSLYFAFGAMVVIYIFHRFSRKFIFPHIKNKRLGRVFFGTLYVIILISMALLILDMLGFQVKTLTHLSIASVIIGSVIAFFLVPFLPRLPFHLGQTVEVNDIFGVISSMDVFRVSIKQLNGTVTTFPTATVMASMIKNYSEIPYRRIKLTLSFNSSSDIELAREIFIQVMTDDERVLNEPKPPITHVINAAGSSLDIAAYCWVNNNDWLSTRTDLWVKLIETLKNNDRISTSVPQQEVIVLSEA